MRFKIISTTLLLLSLTLTPILADDAAATPKDPSKGDTADPKTPSNDPKTDTPANDANGKPKDPKAANAAKAAPVKQGKSCNRELLRTFNMTGLDTAEEMTLDMCGNVKESCCTLDDQLKIYKGWHSSEEGTRLTLCFADQLEIFTDLLLELGKSGEVANRMISATQNMGFSNCRVLGEEILRYNVAMIGPKLKEAIRAQQTVFYESYKGVYCSLCDVNNHQYFLIEKKHMIISQRFCRNLLVNSFHVLVYLHVHLKKLLNMVSVMLTSCMPNGDFNTKDNVPAELYFVVDEDLKQDLYDCREKIDDPKWMSYCCGICEAYSPTRLSELYHPDMEQYLKITTFLIGKMKND